MQDADLVTQIISGDKRAIFFFYQQHESQLHYFISSQIKDPRDVEEVVQDTFIAFFESLRSYRGEASVKTFMYAIAKRKIIDFIRKRKLKHILFSHLPPLFVECLKTVLFDDDLDKKHLEEKIASIYRALPKRYSLILRLKYARGYRVGEIARIIGHSFKSTESLLYRARRAFISLYNSS